MLLPILYKRTRTGAIQYWEVEVNALTDRTAIITKTSGQYGTNKPSENIERVTDQDSADTMTVIEQAKSQAELAWKKKKAQGYKTLDDLGISYVCSSNANSDNVQDGFVYQQNNYKNLKYALEAALPNKKLSRAMDQLC